MGNRILFWERLSRPGLERFELSSRPSRWTLRGTILAPAGREPVEVRYEVVCNKDWKTTGAHVTLLRGRRERSLELAVRKGRWYARGREIRRVRGSIDVDLGWSPSTNTLPIRRLGLRVGESSGPLTMAWVRFPELTVQPLAQEYRRLAPRRYLYGSRQGSFAAELEVDRDGLVVTYGDFWRRVPVG